MPAVVTTRLSPAPAARRPLSPWPAVGCPSTVTARSVVAVPVEKSPRSTVVVQQLSFKSVRQLSFKTLTTPPVLRRSPTRRRPSVRPRSATPAGCFLSTPSKKKTRHMLRLSAVSGRRDAKCYAFPPYFPVDERAYVIVGTFIRSVSVKVTSYGDRCIS